MADSITLIEKLFDEELKQILKHANINHLLNPMFKDRKKYEQQIKKLGQMNAKSPLVKTILPGTVCTLIRRGDKTYIDIISSELDRIKTDFSKFIEQHCQSASLSHDIPESYAMLYWDYTNCESESDDVEYFWILLKLIGDDVDSPLKERVKYGIEQLRNNAKEIAEHKAEVETLIQEYLSEIDRIKRAHSREIKELKQKICRLNDVIQGKKDELEQSWARETSNCHELKIRNLDEEYHSKIRSLEDEFEKRKNEIDAELEARTKSITEKYEEQRKTFESVLARLIKERDELEAERVQLADDVAVLSQRKEQLQSYIDDYFEQFEAHVVQRNIDQLIEGQFAKNAYSSKNRDDIYCDEMSHDGKNKVCIYGGEVIQDGEERDQPEELEDALIDLKDNISIYFEQSYEIAKITLSVLGNNKMLLVDSASAMKLGNAFAALTDAKTAIIIDCNDGNYCLADIIETMDFMTERTILLEGLLDRFDDKVLAGIYANKKDKLVIISYPDQSCLEMMSKKYLQFCIPVFLDGCLKFVDDNNFVVGRYDCLKHIPHLEREELQSCYDEKFKALKNGNFITQNIALELARFFSTYLELSRGGKTSDLMKDSIRLSLGCDASDEKVQKILESADLL